MKVTTVWFMIALAGYASAQDSCTALATNVAACAVSTVPLSLLFDHKLIFIDWMH